MDTVSILYIVLFYAATFVLLFATAMKVLSYARTPAPLRIATTPAPTSRSGVVFRMLKELVLFASLFKSNKWTWLFGWLFHFGLFVVLLRHLRYFVAEPWLWLNWLQPFGKYASIAMIVGLVGLLLRRLAVDRVRYISSPSDHLMLLLLIFIAATGMLMTFYEKVDIISLKAFFLGMISFDPQPLPMDRLILLHFNCGAHIDAYFSIQQIAPRSGCFL